MSHNSEQETPLTSPHFKFHQSKLPLQTLQGIHDRVCCQQKQRLPQSTRICPKNSPQPWSELSRRSQEQNRVKHFSSIASSPQKGAAVSLWKEEDGGGLAPAGQAAGRLPAVGMKSCRGPYVVATQELETRLKFHYPSTFP